MNTKYEDLKIKLLESYNTLLKIYEDDIESGIKERIYEEEANVEIRAFIQEAKQIISEFENYKPSIYMYIEGGLIQGASATEDIDINKFDKDNWDVDEESEEISPEEWENMIQEKTKTLEIKEIY